MTGVVSWNDLNTEQRFAVETIVGSQARVCVLTGGPGVGKTTVLRVALDKFEADGVSFALAAPTGKAARRMFEATGRSAQTVHRLLGYRPGQGFSGEALDASVVVIDESSMLDVHLAAEVVRAVSAGGGRIVLVGDAFQLPSVGPGMVLADLIASQRVPVVELIEVHRSAADSWVCLNAPKIKMGSLPSLEMTGDFAFWSTVSLEQTVAEAVEAARGLTARLGERPLVITPRRTGVQASVEDLNPLLQQALNPHGMRTGMRAGGDEIRVGDTIIQRKNSYLLGVFNGEMGRVVGEEYPTPRVKNLVVQFDGRDGTLPISADDLRTFRLGYCITIHAGQGSEAAWCVVVNHSGHGKMLARQILYTAITRAKKGLLLVGDEMGLERAVRNNQPVQRHTGLAVRLTA